MTAYIYRNAMTMDACLMLHEKQSVFFNIARQFIEYADSAISEAMDINYLHKKFYLKEILGQAQSGLLDNSADSGLYIFPRVRYADVQLIQAPAFLSQLFCRPRAKAEEISLCRFGAHLFRAVGLCKSCYLLEKQSSVAVTIR